MRMASLSAVAILSMASAAFATQPSVESKCSSVEIVSTVLHRHFPDIKLTHIEGDAAQRFVDAFNSGSASTHWPADEVLIARNPKTPERARIGFFKDGCLLALVPRSLWTVDSLQRLLKTEQDI
jgi:hypothetical protein